MWLLKRNRNFKNFQKKNRALLRQLLFMCLLLELKTRGAHFCISKKKVPDLTISEAYQIRNLNYIKYNFVLFLSSLVCFFLFFFPWRWPSARVVSGLNERVSICLAIKFASEPPCKVVILRYYVLLSVCDSHMFCWPLQRNKKNLVETPIKRGNKKKPVDGVTH